MQKQINDIKMPLIVQTEVLKMFTVKSKIKFWKLNYY